jgi:hypothetical protein
MTLKKQGWAISKEDYRLAFLCTFILFVFMFSWAMIEENKVASLKNQLYCGNESTVYKPMYENEIKIGYTCCRSWEEKVFNSETGEFETHSERNCVFTKI